MGIQWKRSGPNLFSGCSVLINCEVEGYTLLWRENDVFVIYKTVIKFLKLRCKCPKDKVWPHEISKRPKDGGQVGVLKRKKSTGQVCCVTLFLRIYIYTYVLQIWNWWETKVTMPPKSILVSQWVLLGFLRGNGWGVIYRSRIAQTAASREPTLLWWQPTPGNLLNLQTAQQIGECPSQVAQLIGASPGSLAFASSRQCFWSESVLPGL